MDRRTARTGRNSGHTRSRSEDLLQQPQDSRRTQRDRSPHRRDNRRNSQIISAHPGDVQHVDETQRLFQDETRQPRGRSRSPGRQENKRNAGRHTSPHRSRQNIHDITDQDSSRTTMKSHSPASRRRDREQSPQRGRKPSVHFQTPNQRHSFHEEQLRNTSETRVTQSPLKSKSRRRSRSQSPNGKQNRSHKTIKSPQLKTLDPRILDAETATARIAVLSIVLHIISIGAALMVIVPMALVSSRWQSVRTICPLYVQNNIGYHVDWGNPNMLTCNLTAFLPTIILTLSVILIMFHYGMLQTWYTNGSPPDYILTRKFAVCTMLLGFVEALVAWTVGCILTDGFRQTCLSFQLSPAPEDRPISCKYGFDDRDETYMFDDLNTFQKLMISLFGSWLCVVATTIMAIAGMVRICACYLK